jgi:hypothetical protein
VRWEEVAWRLRRARRQGQEGAAPLHDGYLPQLPTGAHSGNRLSAGTESAISSIFQRGHRRVRTEMESRSLRHLKLDHRRASPRRLTMGKVGGEAGVAASHPELLGGLLPAKAPRRQLVPLADRFRSAFVALAPGLSLLSSWRTGRLHGSPMSPSSPRPTWLIYSVGFHQFATVDIPSSPLTRASSSPPRRCLSLFCAPSLSLCTPLPVPSHSFAKLREQKSLAIVLLFARSFACTSLGLERSPGG